MASSSQWPEIRTEREPVEDHKQMTMRGWLLSGVVMLAGCGTTYIPNTTVEDTNDNRKVIS